MKTKELQIVGLEGYTIPMFGNKRCAPYGNLIISDGENEKSCPIKEDAADGGQYIVFGRKRRKVMNVGGLWNPIFRFI